MKTKPEIFDAHFHIIDSRFPLVPNNGYLPDAFTCADYVERMNDYTLSGGAIVSGSFQAFDQTYLLDGLKQLGPSFVGVTQLPMTVTDDEISELNAAGVRALRFNLKRSGSEKVGQLEQMANRVYEIAGWPIELYIDSTDLLKHYSLIEKLPAASIDHLGLSKEGFPTLLKLVEQGIRVKATGFGRTDFDPGTAVREIYSVNPASLMFGTDLPSTRAPRPYKDSDATIIVETLGTESARNVFYNNAMAHYGLTN